MRAISSMATRHVLADLLAAATAAGLPATEVESVGGVDAARRVASGEPFELVFLAEDALRRLAAQGHVEATTITPLVRSQVAAAIRADDGDAAQATGPAFTDSGDMRAALLAAGRIGYSTGPSGTELVRMIDDWELMDVLGARLVQAAPGVPVAKMLAVGDVDLGFQQLSELAGQPDVRILGVLPPDCAIDTIFSGAVGNAGDPGRAAELLAFLASDATAPIKRARSFDTP